MTLWNALLKRARDGAERRRLQAGVLLRIHSTMSRKGRVYRHDRGERARIMVTGSRSVLRTAARRATIRIGQQTDGLVHIKSGAEAVFEPFGRIHGDIVQPVQLIDDHLLYQLIGADRAHGRRVARRTVCFRDQIATEQHVESGGPPDGGSIGRAVETFTGQSFLEACARYAIKIQVEDQQIVFESKSSHRTKMAVRINRTDVEVRFSLDAQNGLQQLPRAEQHVFLKSLYIDF